MNEWHVVWVPDQERWGTLPAEDVLGGQGLPEAVARIGLLPGDPVYIRPDGTVDRGLLDFVRSDAFRKLERETKRNYGTDYRTLLNSLFLRGLSWQQATRQDLADYRNWRCDAPGNPERISGTKWNREAAAFTKLFKWGKVYPLPVDVSQREDRAADSVSARVSWLTPRTWGLWSDVGLRGHTLARVASPSWESRTELRNTAFVQLLLSSGLRRQEGGGLLLFELPTQRLRRGRYMHGRLAGALTRSKNSRTYYTSVDAVGQTEAYVQSERAWAVQRAQETGRYERPAVMQQMLLITKVTHGLKPEVEWVDRNGVVSSQELSSLKWRIRQWLFLEGPDGPEPAWLWLTEEGLPMLPDRWNGVFRTANLRCEQVLLGEEARKATRDLRLGEVQSKSPYATPHSARHSFALFMLVLLNDLYEKRYGLTAKDRRDFALLFGDPWWLVKTLLGHADVETTKRHYLAPVAHLQLESILAAADTTDEGEDIEDLNGVFARLARETAGIQDIDVILGKTS
ncbi:MULTISPECIES: phage integrase [Streptomyces]|uniref:phage integrase n=1 Tax=Streptomyces TaxID=1883 RepID=UPI0005A9D7C3|nr:phage integrase [Streptomyces griseus]